MSVVWSAGTDHKRRADAPAGAEAIYYEAKFLVERSWLNAFPFETRGAGAASRYKPETMAPSQPVSKSARIFCPHRPARAAWEKPGKPTTHFAFISA